MSQGSLPGWQPIPPRIAAGKVDSPADSRKTVHFVIKASNLAHIYIILVYENLDIVPSPISRLGGVAAVFICNTPYLGSHGV